MNCKQFLTIALASCFTFIGVAGAQDVAKNVPVPPEAQVKILKAQQKLDKAQIEYDQLQARLKQLQADYAVTQAELQAAVDQAYNAVKLAKKDYTLDDQKMEFVPVKPVEAPKK
jgi:multidrug efflux pump subunit AcrA (membrane-fusion protein)